MPNETRQLDGLHVHVLDWQRGEPDSQDPLLLENALRVAGAKVMRTQLSAAKGNTGGVRASGIRLLRSMDWAHGKDIGPRFDASVHVGHVWRSWFGLARRNLLLAQSEGPLPQASHLQGIDAVLCSAAGQREAFANLDCTSAYIGWTSHDRRRTEVPRERGFFHRASRATIVPTRHLLGLWAQHPEWPRLTVVVDSAAGLAEEPLSKANIRYVGGGVDDNERTRLQNANLFHICLLPHGGGSRDLGEALSVGAVTLSILGAALDAPRDDHGGILVPAACTGAPATRRMASVFDEAAMELAIQRVMAMGDSAMQNISSNARAWFERNRQRFVRDLADVVYDSCMYDQSSAGSRDMSAAANAST